MPILRALLGIVVLLVLAFLLSENRRRISWRVVRMGLLLELILGLLVFKVDWVRDHLDGFAGGVAHFLGFARTGSEMVFGDLALGGASKVGFVFAFSSLTAIIFVSCVMSVLYHLGIMQAVVWVFARGMTALMGVSGAEALSVAANIFLGQTEAPLLIKPYIPRMTRSEVMALMTGGFGTISGSLMGTYMGFVGSENAKHMITASVMAAPAAFIFAKMIIPETARADTAGRVEFRVERTAVNVIDAASAGVSDGLKLWLNVIAMLIAFVSLVALVDWPLSAITVADAPLSITRILGWLFTPVAWCLGVPDGDLQQFGSLIGTKISLNEFVAYRQLSGMVGAHAISAKTQVMATFALCGFANFGSIGIQLGGITPLAPERRQDLAELAFRAMLAGAMTSLMTATIAGALTT